MIEGFSAGPTPTRCHELSDFTARWGLRSCIAARSSSFTSLRAGAGYLNLIVQLAERRWSWWGRVIFYVADVDALYDRALARETNQSARPAMPNGVSASSTSITPTVTNSVSLTFAPGFRSIAARRDLPF